MEIRDKNLPSNTRYISYAERYKAQHNQNPIKREINKGTNKEINNEVKEDIREGIKKAEQAVNAVKRDFKKFESNSDKAIKYADSIVSSRKAKKIEKIILIIIYIVVILIGIYFILASFFPQYLPFSSNTYQIKASDSKIFTLSSFYIDDPSVLGDKVQTSSGVVVRPIISSRKFNFIFKPKENIPKGRNATFTVNLVLNQSNPGPVYINDKLIFPDLSNYQLLKETSTDYIYASNETLKNINKNNFVDSDVTEDYIYKNMPGVSMWATRTLNPVAINLPDYKQENTLINGTFRSDLKLAVYAEGSLDINFTKQDLNWYLGADEYTINVTNSDGQVIYTKTFGDDGDKTASNKLGKEQNFLIKLDSLKNDVYYLNFQSDKNNDAADSTIKSININSNKILILGNFLPIASFEFYTKANSNKNIGFLYWWSGKDQIINITGTKNKNINLSKDWLNKRYDENFIKGDYTIKIDKGYLQIYNDALSPSKSSWFDIPNNQQQNFNNQNIIVIDKSIFNEATGILSYNQNVDTSQIPLKISLRILNPNSVSFNDAKLTWK